MFKLKSSKVMYVTDGSGVSVEPQLSGSGSGSSQSLRIDSEAGNSATQLDPNQQNAGEDAQAKKGENRTGLLVSHLKLKALTVLPAFKTRAQREQQERQKQAAESADSEMEKGRVKVEVWDENLEMLREKGPVKVELSCIDFSRDQVSVSEDIASVDDPLIGQGKPSWASVRWVNIDGIDANIVNTLAKMYKLHPLMVGDICDIVNRPKMDYYEAEGHIFIIAKMVTLPADQSQLDQEHVFFFFDSTSDTILTFQEGRPGDAWANVRRRIQRANSKIRQSGADYFLYTLLEGILDTCYPIVEQFGIMIEDVEFQLLREPTPELNRRVYHLKRQLLLLRRSIWPMRDVVQQLISEDMPDTVIHEDTKPFLKDINNHLLQINDMVETYTELATGLSVLYANQQAQRMNQVMFVLTLVSAVFIPLTFVAGIYGMNFDYFPELTWTFGYAYVWGVFIFLAASILFAFWKNGWIGNRRM